MVFSTHVEVIPLRGGYKGGYTGILHACGGDPWITYLQFVLILYSPRMWRLFFEDESSTGKIMEP